MTGRVAVPVGSDDVGDDEAKEYIENLRKTGEEEE